MTGVFDGKTWDVAGQHRANAIGDPLRIGRFIAKHRIANAHIIDPHAVFRIVERIGAAKLPPCLVDRDDETLGIEQGYMHGKRIENRRLHGRSADAQIILRALRQKPVYASVWRRIDFTGGQLIQALRGLVQSLDQCRYFLIRFLRQRRFFLIHSVQHSKPGVSNTVCVRPSVPAMRPAGAGRNLSNTGVMEISSAGCCSGSRNTSGASATSAREDRNDFIVNPSTKTNRSPRSRLANLIDIFQLGPWRIDRTVNNPKGSRYKWPGPNAARYCRCRRRQ